MENCLLCLRLFLIALIGTLVSACTALTAKYSDTEPPKATTLSKEASGPIRMVVMPLDVEVGMLTAGGVFEPRAEWTELAAKNLRTAMETEAKNRNVQLIDYNLDRGSPEDQTLGVDLIKLHRTVGGAVLRHHYYSTEKLPTKNGQLDWSLGPSVAAIGRTHEADYALFLFVRDSYASTGRQAAVLLSLALGGGAANFNSQAGFASVVDLKTGNITRFNRMLQGGGDLRTEEGAVVSIQRLVTDVIQ